MLGPTQNLGPIYKDIHKLTGQEQTSFHSAVHNNSTEYFLPGSEFCILNQPVYK